MSDVVECGVTELRSRSMAISDEYLCTCIVVSGPKGGGHADTPSPINNARGIKAARVVLGPVRACRWGALTRQVGSEDGCHGREESGTGIHGWGDARFVAGPCAESRVNRDV